MRIVEFDQRSPEWRRWRQAGLGSSDAAAILGTSPWKTASELWREKVYGRGEDRKTSSMQRGIDLEPMILGHYSRWTTTCPTALCVLHDEYDWLKASLDGWVDATGTVVEIKAPNKDDHAQALSGEVPDKYIPQLDHQLLATGGRRVHYVSYNPRFPSLQRFTIVDYSAEQSKLRRLLEAEKSFWTKVLTRTQPN